MDRVPGLNETISKIKSVTVPSVKVTLKPAWTLKESWLCEALRLKEHQWGLLDDRAACLSAEREPCAARQIALRADALGKASGLSLALERVKTGLWNALAVILCLSVFAGVSGALTALHSGQTQVNIMWGLLMLLGVNFLTLTLWFCSLFMQRGSGGWLAQTWQWVAKKLASGPDVALAGQAWWSLWQQAGVQRWVLSCVTHASWCAAGIAMLVTLLLTLSVRHVSFAWETTLLSADTFVAVTQILGAVPQWFGVSIPDSDTIRASGHLSMNSVQAQLLWSNWLLGVRFFYGILPRLLLLTFSLVRVVLAWPRTQPQLQTPYYQNLLTKIRPTSLVPEGSVPAQTSSAYPRLPAGAKSTTLAMLTGIELEGDWPPRGLGAEISHTVLMTSRESRNLARRQIAQLSPRRLVIACDALQTPDRGTLRLIEELSSYAGLTRIWLQQSAHAGARTEVWKTQLQPLSELKLLLTPGIEPVSAWLGGADA